ncbi:hypothetical protein [Streptomyces dioscori]|uniref:hypothetical protein n=1 Tax=Streptomyces dioscori TaxID=2109333 RepID=UPI0018FE6FA7|nr:hypothetical protein [Streptomyces dioscori]
MTHPERSPAGHRRDIEQPSHEGAFGIGVRHRGAVRHVGYAVPEEADRLRVQLRRHHRVRTPSTSS